MLYPVTQNLHLKLHGIKIQYQPHTSLSFPFHILHTKRIHGLSLHGLIFENTLDKLHWS